MSSRISSGAGLTVLHLIKIDLSSFISHPWSREERISGLAIRQFPFSQLGCRDMEEYFLVLTSLVNWNEVCILEYWCFPLYGHKDRKKTVEEH